MSSQWSKFVAASLGCASWDYNILTTVMRRIVVDKSLHNSPSYFRILIGSCLWSIRGQTHDWRHHYRAFASTVLKWRKILRIRIIFYVTGQKIRYKKVFPRHWTGSRSQKAKDKAVSFRKWYRNNFLAASVGSRARLNHANLILVSREPLLYLEFNKPNKQNVSEINLFKKINFSHCQNNCWTLIDVRNETWKHHFLKSLKSNTY